MKHPILPLLTVLIAGSLTTGCRSFESRWHSAAPAPDGVRSIGGRWSGSWQNTNNTHGGALRALIEPSGRDDTSYTARFHATWGGKSGGFKTRLKGHWEGDTFHFTSRRRILGVLITTEGQADPGNLQAGYASRFDVGTFTLTRPAEGR